MNSIDAIVIVVLFSRKRYVPIPMHGVQLVEKLVQQSQQLGALGCQKSLAAETVRRLADEAFGLRQTIADLIQEKKKLRTGQTREAMQDRTVLLTGHQRALRERLRSISRNRQRTLDHKRLIQQRITILTARIATARSRLLRYTK